MEEIKILRLKVREQAQRLTLQEDVLIQNHQLSLQIKEILNDKESLHEMLNNEIMLNEKQRTYTDALKNKIKYLKGNASGKSDMSCINSKSSPDFDELIETLKFKIEVLEIEKSDLMKNQEEYQRQLEQASKTLEKANEELNQAYRDKKLLEEFKKEYLYLSNEKGLQDSSHKKLGNSHIKSNNSSPINEFNGLNRSFIRILSDFMHAKTKVDETKSKIDEARTAFLKSESGRNDSFNLREILKLWEQEFTKYSKIKDEIEDRLIEEIEKLNIE